MFSTVHQYYSTYSGTVENIVEYDISTKKTYSICTPHTLLLPYQASPVHNILLQHHAAPAHKLLLLQHQATLAHNLLSHLLGHILGEEALNLLLGVQGLGHLLGKAFSEREASVTSSLGYWPT